MPTITKIRKRNGEVVNFQQNKITEAIWNAAKSVGGTNHEIAEKIAGQVTTVLEVFFKSDDHIPSVEQIQDLVEKILIENGHAKTAKAYILYREEHKKLREQRQKILDNKGNILLTVPENIGDDQIHELLDLADRIGCGYKAVEPNILTNEQIQDKNSYADPPRLKKMVEEVIPPPVQTAFQ